MKRHRLVTGLAALFLVCSLGVARTQTFQQPSEGFQPPPPAPNPSTTPAPRPTAIKMAAGQIIIPGSSMPPAKRGTTLKTRTAQTSLLLYMPNGWQPDQVTPPSPSYTPAPPFSGYAYETPASISCVYALVAVTAGCNPNTVTASATGGTHSIAVVDAYDDPFAGPDLAYFSSQFGISFNPGQLQVVYENGVVPPVDETGGWELEESLDIEMSHAMAPSATIYLVEAQSDFDSDLLTSVQIAGNLVRCGQTEQDPTTLLVGSCPSASTGTGEVSMSWGNAEFSTETSYDSYFTQTGVVYFASAGDSPGTEWPCVSPDIVCVGGTSIRRSASTGAYINEVDWPDAGGGLSLYETAPSYQKAYISSIVGTARGVPDVSLDGNPITGAWIWDSFDFALDTLLGEPVNSAGWWIVGGTSLGTPTWAGIVNHAGAFAASSNAELTKMYANRATATDYRDITSGWCGPYLGYTPVAGWDFCTGIGADQGYTGK
jgi:kumamolisin